MQLRIHFKKLSFDCCYFDYQSCILVTLVPPHPPRLRLDYIYCSFLHSVLYMRYTKQGMVRNIRSGRVAMLIILSTRQHCSLFSFQLHLPGASTRCVEGTQGEWKWWAPPFRSHPRVVSMNFCILFVHAFFKDIIYVSKYTPILLYHRKW